MAEALISIVLGQLAVVARQHIEEEWSLVNSTEGKVESLITNLEDIHAVLVDAEKRQIKEEIVKRWLHKLKEVSYEMDTVLDEWNTAIILRSNLKLPNKVCLFTHSCFHPKRVHRPGLHRRMACKIEELSRKLDKISKEKERYAFASQNLGRHPFGTTTYSTEYERPNTTSFVDVSEVYGRDTEKRVLVSKLLSESSQAVARGPDVIPIVGMGGIGKTTLAQFVYNDEKVDDYFNLKIWVCVSDPFDEITIAKAILEALKVGGAHKLVQYQTLLHSIHESIKGKRFLLVLDDVWTENDSKWESLEKSLRSGEVGSKILVTTRKERVAIMMRAETRMITLKCLSEEICWHIFYQLAFLDKDKHEQLEEIGKQIALKCKGLPLVAKALGSLMRFKKFTKKHWEEVLHSALWELGDEIENKVFIPFLLSYYDLPPLEKRCFLYCSYFPKDYTIDRDELVQLWMSQGYLSSRNDREEKGVECFENLAMRSFFQNFEKDDEGNIIRCKMHDIVHDFVLFLTRNECLNILIKTYDDRKKLAATAFHCTLLLESDEHEIPSSFFEKGNLRTLCVGNSGTIRWDLLIKLTCLRTLNLSRCSFSRIPENIDNLILLRYLDLSQNSSLIELPKTLGNLFNLETLKLEGCSVKLPKEIEKLVNLRHLYLDEYGRVDCPKELRKLTSLETLDHINVGGRMELGDLNHLNNLKGRLHLFGLGVTKGHVDQAEKAQLKSKEHLVALVLQFFNSGYQLDFEREYPLILEGLQPHPNLKHLEISEFYGTKLFPSWMTSLTNLKRLVLLACDYCKSLGPFGKLPSLELLTIQYMRRVTKVDQEFLGLEEDTTMMESGSKISFPKLKRLELTGLWSCKDWASCASSNSAIIMPCLVSLEIRDCNSLMAPLPEFLRRTPLESFIIRNCPILEQHFQEGLETKVLVNLLTSPTSEFNNTATDMAEVESC